jgi:hypothetical protein
MGSVDVEFGAAGEGAKHGAMLFDERADRLKLVNLAEHSDHTETRRVLSEKVAHYNAS